MRRAMEEYGAARGRPALRRRTGELTSKGAWRRGRHGESTLLAVSLILADGAIWIYVGLAAVG